MGAAVPAATVNRRASGHLRMRGSRLGEALAVVLAYSMVTIWLYWGAIVAGPGAVFETPGALNADGDLITWILSWDCHALWTAPWRLFDANIFHPAPQTLAGSEHMLGHLPLFAPVYALSGDPALAIQFTRLASVTLCGVAMYALLRHWGVGILAAMFAGFVYGYCPTRYLTIHALQLVAVPYLPLALIYLDRTLDRGRLRDALPFAALLLLQMLCSFYLAYLSAATIGVYGLVALWYRQRTGQPVKWAAGLIALGAVFVLMGLLSLPYLSLAGSGAIPTHSEAVLTAFSARPLATYWTRPGAGGAKIGSGYLGIVPTLLGCLALAVALRRRTNLSLPVFVSMGVCVAMYILALGPTLVVGDVSIPLPYRLANSVVPGFSAMRVPLRFTFGFVLGVAALAGIGMQAALDALPSRRGRHFALLLAVLVTSVDFGHLAYVPRIRKVVAADAIPAVYRELERADSGPLLEIPIALQGDPDTRGADREARYMYMSTFHWRPLLNGYTGYPPRSAAVIKRIAQMLPGDQPLRLLQRMTGLKYVIVHFPELRPAERERWREPDGLVPLSMGKGNALFGVAEAVEADLSEAVVSGAARGLTVLGNVSRGLDPAERLGGVEIVGPGLRARVIPQRFPTRVEFEVRNDSSVPWPVLTREPEEAVMIEYRWLGAGDAGATGLLPLPYDVAAQSTLRFSAKLPVPRLAGDYRLEIGLRQGDARFASGAAIDGIVISAWPPAPVVSD